MGGEAPQLSDQDRAVLRRALQLGWLRILALCAAILGFVALTTLLLSGAGFVQRDPVLLLLLVMTGWVWLFRKAPSDVRAMTKDLTQSEVSTLTGHAQLSLRRGFGLLAPTHRVLSVRNRSFRLSHDQHAKPGPDGNLTIRFGLNSGVLLAIDEPEQQTQANTLTPVLTEREEALLELMAKGLSDKLIARELGLSPGTVRTYNSSLFQKLGVSGRAEAVEKTRNSSLLDVN